MIGSDKVEGTSVYGADETQIGTIERVMIDKWSGKVSYAVLSFGGLLGIGDDHYPLPWESLKYDTNLGGYRTGITEQQLQGAPKYGNDNEWSWEDQTRAGGQRLLRGHPCLSLHSDRKKPASKAGFFRTVQTENALDRKPLATDQRPSRKLRQSDLPPKL